MDVLAATGGFQPSRLWAVPIEILWISYQLEKSLKEKVRLTF